MREIKKLLCLNLALILCFSCFTIGIANHNLVSAAEQHTYAQYIIVDGVEYDATVSPKGSNWKFIYDEQAAEQVLELTGYNGGPIYTNVSVNIKGHGENKITGDDGYGIYVDGDLRIGRVVLSNDLNGVSVVGGTNHAAVNATGTLICDGPIVAKGGGTSALKADMIHITDQATKVIFVGTSAEDAVEGDYTGQEFFSMHFIPYTLTLEGNGGKTAANEESLDLVFRNGSAGSLNLYRYNDTFSNDSNVLLGWTENRDGSGELYERTDSFQFAPDTFAATLYAFWDNSENKAVTLNGYYDAWDDKPQTKVIPCKVGDHYTLPVSEKPGCRFNGWRDQDNQLLSAGSEIVVTDNVSLTAEYTPLEFTVDGQTYDASVSQGNNTWGWSYEPYSARNIRLRVYEQYSGGPIAVPFDVNIEIEGSLSGSAGQPAIDVDGDVSIQGFCSTQSSIRLAGGANASAVKATGNLFLNVFGSAKSLPFTIVGGEQDCSALSAAGNITIYKGAYQVGADEDNLTLVGNYSGEHFLRFPGSGSYSVELTGTTTVPNVPDSNLYTFLGWYVAESSPRIWYKPGDAIAAGTATILIADYMNKNDRTTVGIMIDGNGGRTSYGSHHYVHILSSAELALYKLPTAEFSYTGHTFKSYNTLADGTGTNYPKCSVLADDGRTVLYQLYAQWEKTPVNGGGPGGGGGGGGGGNNDTAQSNDSFENVIKKAENNGTIVLQADSSKERATLTKENLDAILAKKLNVTVETPNGSLQLSADQIEKIKKENGLQEMEIAIEEKTNDQNLALGGVLFNIAVLAGGKEQHNLSGLAKVRLDSVKAGDIVTAVHYNEDGTIKEVFFITSKEHGLVEFNFGSLSRYAFLSKDETPAATVFNDMKAGSWYENAVNYVYLRKLFAGTAPNAFSPDLETNREMFVTVLYRLSGSPTAVGTVGTAQFSDVANHNAYYYNPILWATENGIINGYDDGRFGVGDTITREQMVAMLYRYAKDYAKEDVSVGKDTNLSGYNDVPEDSNDAFRWAVGAGIIKGTSSSTLSPRATATRAQVAQLLMNYCLKMPLK